MENYKQIKIFNNIIENLTVEDVILKYKNVAKSRAYNYSCIYRCEYDDLYQSCLIAIWKAYDYYKLPYNFYGVAIKFMKFEMLNYINKINKYNSYICSSLNECAFINKDGDEVEVIDTLGEEDKTITTYAETDIARRLLSALTERQRDEIISISVNENSKKKLAEKYNVNYATFLKRAEKTFNRFRILFIKEESA